MNRRELMQLGVGAAASSALPLKAQQPGHAAARRGEHPAAGARRPNLLFLFTDQQRQDTMACYGNREIRVPNLNRLAAQSTVFHQCYTTQPICTPARASLQTGLWPHTHGDITNNIALPETTPVLVQMLQPGAYATAYFGKWHLGNEIFRQHGFDEFESTEDTYNSYYDKTKGHEADRTRSGYHRWLIAKGQTPDEKNDEFSRAKANALGEDLSKPAYLAEVATDFMQRRHGNPWALYVNFLDPHTPFTSAYDAMYDPAKMTVPATFAHAPDDRELLRNKRIRERIEKGEEAYPGIMRDEKALREVKAKYWGKVSLVDKMVGRIVDRLTQLGEMDNTIIVFTTDHGEMMGDHRLVFKSVMYEEAAKVPMLLKLPGQRTQVDVRQPTSHINVVPTLLDLMQQPVPPHLQGVSWAPYLQASKPLPNTSAIVEWNAQPWPFNEGDNSEPLRAIAMADGWKLVLASDGAGELYQLRDDPREINSLFYQESSLPVIKRLVAEIHLWQKSTGDTPLEFNEARWRQRSAQLRK